MNMFYDILLETAIKSFLLITVVLAVSFLGHRISSAQKHAVLLIGMLSLLALPVATILLPVWNVIPGELIFADSGPPEARSDSATSSITKSERELQYMPASAENIAEIDPKGGPTTLPPIVMWTILIWSAGVFVTSLIPAFSWVALAKFRSRCEAVDPPDSLLSLLKDCADRLKISWRVRLLCSGVETMPLVFGVKGTIILPHDAWKWPEARTRFVVLHELAHIKRFDYVINVVMWLLCAIYWFNPLVWLTVRRMSTLRELACDDLVLSTGSCPTDYAQEIVSITQQFNASRVHLASALCMARTKPMETRIRAILDNRVSRNPLHAHFVLGLITASCVISGSLAAIGASPKSTPQNESSLKSDQKPESAVAMEVFRPWTSQSGETSWTRASERSPRGWPTMMVRAHRGDRWPIFRPGHDDPLAFIRMIDGDAASIALQIDQDATQQITLTLDVPASITLQDTEVRLTYASTSTKGSEPLYVDHATILVQVTSPKEEARTQLQTKLTGVVKIGRGPAKNQTIIIRPLNAKGQSAVRDVETDDQGRFRVENLPPGQYVISRLQQWSSQTERFSTESAAGTHSQVVEIKVGGETMVQIGGSGSALKGKLASADPSLPTLAYTAGDFRFMTPLKRVWEANSHSVYVVNLHEDGSFAIEDVPPGLYELFITVKSAAALRPDEPDIAQLKTTVSIPAEGKSVLDLGTLLVSKI